MFVLLLLAAAIARCCRLGVVYGLFRRAQVDGAVPSAGFRAAAVARHGAAAAHRWRHLLQVSYVHVNHFYADFL